MKSRSSLPAIAATLLLHLGLIAAIVFGLPDSTEEKPRQEPIRIALLQPPSPAAPQAPPPPAATVMPQPEKRPPVPAPRIPQRPEPSPRNSVAASQPKVDAVTETKQHAPAATGASTAMAAAPSAATPATTSPAQALGPARTSVTDAAYASTNRKPPYPRLSRSNEEEGTVILRVLVKADGTAGTVEVKSSSGYPRLDEAARSTVQTWRFSPATVDGKPVTEWYQVAIPFTLHNN